MSQSENLTFHKWVRPSILEAAELEGTRLVRKLDLEASDSSNTSNNVNGIQRIRFLNVGDVAGLKASAIKHMAPAPFTSDAESTKLVHVDFHEKDLPWRYTPQLVTNNGNETHLKPWMVLLVGTAKEIQIVGQSATVAKTVLDKHDLNSSYQWAHTQGEKQEEFSRIVSPSKLVPQSEHVAILVPAFDGNGNPKWDAQSDHTLEIQIYHSWRFWTAEAGDFESLASALNVYKAGDIGLAKLSYRHRTPEADGTHAVTELKVGGAITSLKPDLGLLDTASMSVEQLREVLQLLDPEFKKPDAGLSGLSREQLIDKVKVFQQPMTKTIWDANEDLDRLNDELKVDGQKIIGLPAYGRPWIVDPDSVDNGWPDQINDDPRFRGIAGLGSWMGIQGQESLIQAAVTQAGALQDARQLIGDLALGLCVSRSLWDRQLPTNKVERLRILGPMMSRMITDDGGIVLDRVTGGSSPLPPALFSGVAQRILRSGSNHTKHLRGPVIETASAIATANRPEPAPNPFRGLPKIDELIEFQGFKRIKEVRGEICGTKTWLEGATAELEAILKHCGQVYREAYREFLDLQHTGNIIDVGSENPMVIDLNNGNFTYRVKAIGDGPVKPTIVGGKSILQIEQTVSHWSEEINRPCTPLEIEELTPPLQQRARNGEKLCSDYIENSETYKGNNAFPIRYDHQLIFTIAVTAQDLGDDPFICAKLRLEKTGTQEAQEIPIIASFGGPITDPPNDGTLRSRGLYQLNSFALDWLRNKIEQWVQRGNDLCINQWHLSLQDAIRKIILGTAPIDLLYEPVAQKRFVDDFSRAVNKCLSIGIIDKEKPEISDLCPSETQLKTKPIELNLLGGLISDALDPRQETPPAMRRVCGRLQGIECGKLTPPEFPIGLDYPTWDLLRAHDEEWLLPGVGSLKKDSITALRTNPAFIDAFMVGINTQFLAEMRWRGLAVDRKCTPLRMFWGQIDTLSNKRQADIEPLQQWANNPSAPLGDRSHQTLNTRLNDESSAERLVLVFRSDLFRRYPSTLVYLAKPDPANDIDVDQQAQNRLNEFLKAKPNLVFESTQPEKSPAWQQEWEKWTKARKHFGPVFVARIRADVTFFIFDIPPDTLDQYWLILEEPPTELRFRPSALNSSSKIFFDLDQPTRVAWEGIYLENRGQR